LSHYDDVLRELRQKGQILANKYIVELYNILRDEEKLPPQDCRSKIEHDCIDLWSKATIRKYLSPEAKDTKKQKAGKLGVEKKKELQVLAAQNGGARINLAEDDSNSQNEAESKTSHNELQKLSARVTTPERNITKVIEDKDKRIKELEAELEELVKQGSWVSNKTNIIFLPSKFVLEIYQTTSVNRSAGAPSEFNLEHDGNQVIKVNEVSKRSEVASR
jgi:archaellum component FlaC